MSRKAFGKGFMLKKDDPKREPPKPKTVVKQFFDDQGRAIDEPLRHKTSAEEISALENIDYYHQLRVPDDATPEEIKKAFQRAALRSHPDRTTTDATAEIFQDAVKAFHVLSNDRLRRIYDEARREERLKTVGGRKGMSPGEVDVDPATVRPDALVITCDFCRRPSSGKCGVCELNICGPCKFKPHQAPGFKNHWPFVASSKLSLKVIQQQKEREEKERLKLMWYGDEEEDRKNRETEFLRTIHRCLDPANLRDGRKDFTELFNVELGKYYGWTQDEKTVSIAIRMPHHDTSKQPVMKPEGDRLVITQEDLGVDIIDRRLTTIVPPQDVGMYTLSHMQHLVLVIEKDPNGTGVTKHWKRLFEGDSDYCRYFGKQPYEVAHPEEGWTNLTFAMPAEAKGTDVELNVDTHNIELKIGTFGKWLHVKRHFRDGFLAHRVDSTWHLDESDPEQRRLVVTLRTTEEFGTWGGRRNEEERTATVPTKAYANVKEDIPVLFKEDLDPEMTLAACAAVLHMERGDEFAPRAALGVDATNYLGVLDGTGVPPTKHTAKQPEIDYTTPYPWSQTRTNVEIQIPVPRQQLNAVQVTIGARELKVVIGGVRVHEVCGEMFGPVLGDDSFWDLDRDDGILTIGLAKIEVGDPKLREDKGEWKRFMKNR